VDGSKQNGTLSDWGSDDVCPDLPNKWVLQKHCYRHQLRSPGKIDQIFVLTRSSFAHFSALKAWP